MSLVSLGQPSQLCLLPASCPHPAYLLGGQSDKQRKHRHCAGTVHQYLKHQCVINTVLVTNVKHGNIWAAMKEANFIRARLSSPVYTNMFKRYFTFSCSFFGVERWTGTSLWLHLHCKLKETKSKPGSHRYSLAHIHTTKPSCTQKRWWLRPNVWEIFLA